MIGIIIFISVLTTTIPVCFSNPTPLNDFTINLNLDESSKGDGQNVIDVNDRDLTNANREKITYYEDKYASDENKKKLNDYENEDVTDLNGCVKEKGFGYNEDSIDSKRVVGEGECVNWCGGVGKCEFWAFTDRTKSCNLFGSHSVKRKQSSRISGTKRCAKGGPSNGHVEIQSKKEEDYNLSKKGNGKSTLNHAFKGYDIFYGSPIAPKLTQDPGYRQHIFDIKYEGDADSPIGTSITECTNCNFEIGTEMISGMEGYLNSLQSIVNVGGSAQFEFFTAKFAASSNYQTVDKETSTNLNFLSHSQVKCCTYSIKIDEIDTPPFTKSFLDQVALLKEENHPDYTEFQYQKLISVFGTHFVSKATFGSMFGEQSIISKEEWASINSEGINVKAAAGASALVEFLSANSTLDIHTNRSKTFDKYATDQEIYTKGSYLLKNMSVTEWLAETKVNYEPIYFELKPILNLFVDKSIGLKVTQGVYDKVKQTYKNYCEQLEKSTHVKSCKAPGPDRGFPHGEFPRVWKKWMTNIRLGDRPDSIAPQCDDFHHVTWIKFVYVDILSRFGVKTRNIHIFTDLLFGCSNDRSYNMTGMHHDGEKKTLKMTCNNNNGFMRMRMMTADYFVSNAQMQCFDDTKEEFVIPQVFDKVFDSWHKWVACDEDKNERMVGFEVQQMLSDYHVRGNKKEGFKVINDIRFRCARFY